MMADTKAIAIGGVAVLVIAGMLYSLAVTGGYKTCRSGNTYANWTETKVQFQYLCGLTNSTLFCEKVSGSRCYEMNVTKSEPLARQMEGRYWKGGDWFIQSPDGETCYYHGDLRRPEACEG